MTWRCRQRTFRNALTFLLILSHQYVFSDLIQERTYTVVKGSGMARHHSGVVEDARFLTVFEHDFGTEDMEDRLDLSYGISHYFRYEDGDIDSVAAHRMHGMEFVQLK